MLFVQCSFEMCLGYDRYNHDNVSFRKNFRLTCEKQTKL